MLSKRAQVSDTMVWIVATLIILFVLFVFIFVSGLLADAKDVVEYSVNVGFSEGHVDIERVSAKTEFAFDIDSTNKEVIEQWLE